MNEHAVGFVDEDGHVAAVGQVDDFLQIGAYAEIRRVNDQDRFGVRMAIQGTLDGFGRNAVVDPQVFVACRRHEHGLAPEKMMADMTDL